MKVLHILDHSLPYLSGYSYRSQYIIRHQRRLGLDPVVVTSPKHEDFTTRFEKIDDVDYFRLHWPSFSPSPQISQRLQIGRASCREIGAMTECASCADIK